MDLKRDAIRCEAAHQAIAARRRKYPPITMMSTTLRLLMAFGPWLRVDVRALKHCPAALLPRFLRSPGFETAKNLRIFAPGRYDSRRNICPRLA